LDNALEKAKYGSDFVFDCVSQRDFSKLEEVVVKTPATFRSGTQERMCSTISGGRATWLRKDAPYVSGYVTTKEQSRRQCGCSTNDIDNGKSIEAT
jgi:hypothetical protein